MVSIYIYTIRFNTKNSTVHPHSELTHICVISLSQHTSWSWVLPENLIDPQLHKKFTAFYGTRRFTTPFTKARHVSPSLLYRRISPVPRSLCMIRKMCMCLGKELLAPRPKLEDHPLLAFHDCLFNIFAAILHTWRPFLHLQPEDAPCSGNRRPTYHWYHLYIQNLRIGLT